MSHGFHRLYNWKRDFDSSEESVGFGLNRFFLQLHARGTDSGFNESHYYFAFLGSESHHVFALVAGAYVLTVLISSLFMIYLSHKIAGPIVRLKSYFEEIEKNGTVHPLQFRKGDFFEELPSSINQALKKFR